MVHTSGPARRLPRWAFLVLVIAVAVAVAVVTWSSSADGGADPEAERPRPTREQPGAVVSAFPDATTTGVPAGTRLTPSGPLRIDEDGAVVDGLDIAGSVLVEADDVVIRNSRITSSGGFPVRLKGSNLLIEDTEIDGQGKGYAAVAFSTYTLRRVHIHHVTEGPRIAGNDVTIEDSYIHSLVQRDDNHTDAVQLVGGTDIVLRGNNLQAYNPESGLFGNAAFMFGEDDKPVRRCLVEANLMNGGNYTVNGGGSGTTGAACTFRDNQFERDFRYGARANLGDNVDWDSSNTWHDTGEPVAASSAR